MGAGSGGITLGGYSAAGDGGGTSQAGAGGASSGAVGSGGSAGAAAGGGPMVSVGGTGGGTTETAGMGGAGSSAPRCGADAPHCPEPLICVAAYCVDCTNVHCPEAGEPVIVVDYDEAPDPAPVIALGTTLEQADIALAVDTTNSMGSPIANLKSGLLSRINALQAAIPSVAFGVVSFKDFGDTYVVHADQRIQTADTSAGATSLQAALSGLAASGGGDTPEAGWEALYAVTGGTAISVAGYSSSIPLATTAPSPVTAGEEQGPLPGLGFRQDALPIVVTLTDAEWHDAPGAAAGGENGLNDYAVAYAGVPSRATVLSRLQATGTRVIGIAAGTSPKLRAAALATQSLAFVDPSAFGDDGVRPSACSKTQCCTGPVGAGEAPDTNGHCPLAYSYDSTSATGVSTDVVASVIALVSGGYFDISVAASDSGNDESTTFLARLELVTDGSGDVGCLTAPGSALSDRFAGSQGFPGTDGVLDTIAGANLGPALCVRVVPKLNTSIPRQAAPQFWSIQIQAQRVVTAMAALGLPQRITFMVPPM
jgi:hypothetical protein